MAWWSELWNRQSHVAFKETLNAWPMNKQFWTRIFGPSASENLLATRSNSSPRPGERLTLSFRPMDGVWPSHLIAREAGRFGSRTPMDQSRFNSRPSLLQTFGFANAPRWSPDGRQIAFMAMIDGYRDIYLIPAEGGAPRRLTTEPSLEGRPSWSQDGRWIYFYSTRTGEQEIWKMPVEGGQAVQVTSGGGHESFESPDGKLLYYQFRNAGMRSISTSETSPKAGEVLLPGVQQSFWAVGDKGIYFVEFEDHSKNPRRGTDPYLFAEWSSLLSKVSWPIQFYDFATHKTKQVGVIDRPVYRSHPAFSVTRDGSRIAWSQIDHAESDLMMIENFR